MRIDRGFESWASWIYRHAWWVIGFWIVVLGVLVSQATHNSIDADLENMLDAKHPASVRNIEFKDQFGRSDSILLGLVPDDVFDLDFLTWLRQLHHAIEDELPYLDEVNSLIDARVTRGEADELIVEDLFEDWPPTAEYLAQAREYATRNPLYQNLLLSRDHNVTVLSVELSNYPTTHGDALGGFDEEGIDPSDGAGLRMNGYIRNQTVQALLEIIEKHPRPGLDIHMTGSPVVGLLSGQETVKGTAQFMALAFLGIATILVFLFRRLSGALLPLAIAVLTILATFGVSGFRGVPLNITAQIIPSLLLAVNVSASIHIIFGYLQNLDAGQTREQALRSALGHSALPVVFASMTTAGGLLSFLGAELVAVRDIGLLAPIGITVGLALCLSLLPALLVVLPIRAKSSGSALTRPGIVQDGLVAIGDLAARRPWTTIVCCCAVASIAIAGATRLHLTFDPIEFLPPSHSLVHSTHFMNEEFSGSNALELIIDSGRENGLHDPAMLASVSRLYERTPELRAGLFRELRVGKSLSYVDIVKEIHQALNENRPEFYTVPGERELAAQELLLFENSGSDDLEEFVDSPFRQARFTLRVPFVGGERFVGFIPEVLTLFREELPEGASAHAAGSLDLFVSVVNALSRGTVRSYTLALVVITPLMMLLIGSFRGGLASMLPNLLPIGMALGLIGWVSGAFSLFTILIGGIAIGLAVDDTIHVFHQFHRSFHKLGDARQAIHETMRTTGLALLTTSTVLALGFFVFASSSLPLLQAMGWGLMCSIVLAFLADIILAPALLSLLYRNRGFDAS